MADFIIIQGLSRSVNRSSTFLNNSENVIRNSNLIHKNIIGMQSGFRGFLLTEQTGFLQSYYDGLHSVPPLIAQQYQLISNPEQSSVLDSISKLHKMWIEYADSLIITKLDTLPESNVRFRELFEKKVKMEVGKKLNDEISLLFERFDEKEYRVRQQRRLALEASIANTRNTTIMLTLLSIFFAVSTSYYIIRIITKRISKMVNFASEISKGNFISLHDNKKDELRKLSDSLNSMSQTLDQIFKTLQKKNEELDQFAYVVSHDLKAPLRGIDNITKWMIEDHGHEITPAIKNNIGLIRGRTQRLEKMINGLLDYARVGKIKKRIEEVDSGKLVNELIEILVPDSFSVKIETGLPVLYTERIRLEQVFSNIINNAYTHNNKANGEIRISSVESKSHYQFTISDNGPGIQKEYFEKVFVIFQTLQERDAFESTGVGLAIVKKIIEDQGGKIWIESENGSGSSFVFTWPKVFNK